MNRFILRIMNNLEENSNEDIALKESVSAVKMMGKADYKKTKLGWIPETWNIKSLDELGKFSKGKGIAKKDILEEGIDGLPCVRYAEIYTRYHNYTTSFKSRINKHSVQNSNSIEKGDIIFASSGETLEDIGKSIAYLGYENAYAGGDTIILKQGNEDSQYLGYLLNNDIVRKQLFKLGQGHSVVHIYSSSLRKILLPLPPLREQQKIASILGTWDKAISLQEKLINEKQELKKGLMQQLLTGKKRFPGFTGEWEEVKLEEVCDVKGKYGIGAAAVEFSNELPRYLRITDIDDQGNYSPQKEVSVSDKNWNDYVLEEGDIVFARTGNTTGKTYLYKERDGVLVYAGFLIKFRPNQNYLSSKFLKFYTQTAHYWYWVQTMSVRSGQPGINSKEYGKLKLFLPKIEEQEKIAYVLTGFDTEIERLIEYKDSLIQQKQGLMQQLLTGKKRVKI